MQKDATGWHQQQPVWSDTPTTGGAGRLGCPWADVFWAVYFCLFLFSPGESVPITCTGKCSSSPGSTTMSESPPGEWPPSGAGPASCPPTCRACGISWRWPTGPGTSSSTSVLPTTPSGEAVSSSQAASSRVLLPFPPYVTTVGTRESTGGQPPVWRSILPHEMNRVFPTVSPNIVFRKQREEMGEHRVSNFTKKASSSVGKMKLGLEEL